MPQIIFGKLEPDQPSVNRKVMRVADNVMWHANAYRPLPGRGDVGLEHPLPELEGYDVITAASYLSANSNSLTFLVVQSATDAKVVAIVNGAATIISDYAATPSPRWNIVQFGEAIVIASRNNNLLKIDFTTPTEHSEIVGKGDLVAVVRNRLFHAGDITAPNRVRFSGIGDPTIFDPAHGTNPGGEQIIHDQGPITALTGGMVGHVFCENGINRFIATGNNFIYQVDNISGDIGCRRGGAAIRVGNIVYFQSDSGFKRLSGAGVEAIGQGKVDMLLDDDDGEPDSRNAFHWRDRTTIIFYHTGSTGPGIRAAFAYNYIENAFTTMMGKSADSIDWRGWVEYAKAGKRISDDEFVGKKISDNKYATARISDAVFGAHAQNNVEFVIEDAVLKAYAVGNGVDFTPRRVVATLTTGEFYPFDWEIAEGLGKDSPNYGRAQIIKPGGTFYIESIKLTGDTSILEDDDANSVKLALFQRQNSNDKPFAPDMTVNGVVDVNQWCFVEGVAQYAAIKLEIAGRWGYLVGAAMHITGGGDEFDVDAQVINFQANA